MRTILAVIACAGLACAGPAAAHAQNQTLTAPGFTTQFPAGWALAKNKRQGVAFNTLTAPGTTVPNIYRSIPRDGGIAITVSTSTAARYKKVTKHAAPKRGLAMLDGVGIPRAAKKVKNHTKGAKYKLDGVSGASVAVTYTYNGIANLQSDVSVRKGNRLVLIELNCRPDLEQAGQAALSVVLSNWHWQ